AQRRLLRHHAEITAAGGDRQTGLVPRRRRLKLYQWRHHQCRLRLARGLSGGAAAPPTVTELFRERMERRHRHHSIVTAEPSAMRHPAGWSRRSTSDSQLSDPPAEHIRTGCRDEVGSELSVLVKP